MSHLSLQNCGPALRQRKTEPYPLNTTFLVISAVSDHITCGQWTGFFCKTETTSSKTLSDLVARFWATATAHRIAGSCCSEHTLLVAVDKSPCHSSRVDECDRLISPVDIELENAARFRKHPILLWGSGGWAFRGPTALICRAVSPHAFPWTRAFLLGARTGSQGASVLPLRCQWRNPLLHRCADTKRVRLGGIGVGEIARFSDS